MILIYSHKLTNRLTYIFDTLLSGILGIELEYTDSVEKFTMHEGPKLNYSNTSLESGLFFQCSNILFETGIKEQTINVSTFEDLPCFFSVGRDAVLPFDPFGVSFYLISRYEEYLPHIKDQHERFPASESLAYMNGFLDEPLVNQYVEVIAKKINEKYPELVFPTRKFTFISTIDIDNAYAYKHKGFIRTIGGMLKGIKDGGLSQRLKVLFGQLDDPYDTFAYQKHVHQQYNCSPIYFFLLGDYGINDKNVPVKNSVFQSLIKSISDHYEVGIHPSYASNNSRQQLQKEVNRLSDLTHRNVARSRQHFLKLSLPDTYRNLLDLDILEDHTMGYAEQPGFRASICTPFYFYDLDAETTTKLKVIPFAVMEATFKYYLELSPEKSWEQILALMQKVKNVKGTFVSVWHNESMSEQGEWIGWRWLYEQLLEEGQK